MGEDLELSLPLVASSVRKARDAAVSLGRACGLAEEKLADLQLAVSEAVTNAVQHGTDPDARVLLRATADAAELRIAISDRGGGMRPRADSPGLGLGMPLMAAVSDHLEVHSDERGTTVTMGFRCGEPRAESG